MTKTTSGLPFCLTLLLLLLHSGCKPLWITVIHRGQLQEANVREVVDVEILHGLMIVPVRIRGNTYRFLFDSGAPNSISRALQQELDFDIIGRGKIIDSNGGKAKTRYAGIDTLYIGNVPFLNQTAFIGDFKSNASFGCLRIDGIIGSNLIRLCNWKVDFGNSQVTFSTSTLADPEKTYASTPFHTDIQYNLLVDIQSGGTTITNLTIDYGSNGSLLVPNNVFAVLKENQVIDRSYTILGSLQSGITGKLDDSPREMAYLDSVRLNNCISLNNQIVTGASGLIGTQLLSRSVVIIDWDKQRLLFEDSIFVQESYADFGFKMGTRNDRLYIQSVIGGSSAYTNGIRPNMQVLELDHLDFTAGSTFCDFIHYESGDNISMILSDLSGERKEVTLVRSALSP